MPRNRNLATPGLPVAPLAGAALLPPATPSRSCVADVRPPRTRFRSRPPSRADTSPASCNSARDRYPPWRLRSSASPARRAHRRRALSRRDPAPPADARPAGRRSLPGGGGNPARAGGLDPHLLHALQSDVVFLDRERVVVGIARGLRPWRAAGRSGAHATLELASGECAERELKIGDRLLTW